MAARSGLSQGDDFVPLESRGSWPPEEAFEQDYYPESQHAAHAAFAAAHEPLANRSNLHGAGHPVPHTVAKKPAAKQRKATERKPRARKPREPKPAVPDGPKISHHLGSAGGGLGGYNSSTAHARSAATPLLSAEDYGLDGRDTVPWDRGMAAAHALAVRAATSARRNGATPLHTDPQLPRASEIDLESLSKEQRYALDLAMTGKSFFFTGPGGTGKSYLLKVLVSQLLRKFAYKGVYVTASTGVAACNINGITLHAWAGLGLAEAPVDKLIGFLLRDSRKAKTKQRWLDAQVLIIDEVSMLAGDFFEKLDKVGRGVRNQPDLPFGGIQLIVAGDFLQLPPVKQPTWCFETRTWQEAIREVVQLTHVFRQSDREFVALLNDIRFGQVSSTTRHKLDACVGKKVPTGGAVKPTRLFPHKASVEEENLKEYSVLDTEEMIYKSRDWGNPDYPDVLNSLQKDCQAAETVKLRVGAQVMLVKNVSLEEKLFNGARGVVVGFVEEKIVIDGREQVTKQRLPLVEWAHGGRTVVTQADFTAEIAGVIIASRTQLPLTHAWALSIHKAQGSTLDFVEVSLGETFEYGQSYVALSRARSMDGLFIRSINYKRIMAHPKALAFYRALPPAIFSPAAPAAASALDVLNRTAQQGEEKKAAPAPVPFPPPAFANAQAAMWAPAAATNLHAPTIAASQASVPQSQPIAVLAASQRPAAAVPASQGVVRHNLEISSFSRSQPPAFGAPGGSKVKPLPTPQRAASLSAQVLTLPPPPPPPPMPALLPQIAALPPPPPRVTLLPDLSAVKSEPLIQGSTPPLPSAAGDVIVIDDSPARPASDGLTEGEARAPIKEIDLDDLSEMEQEVVNARSNSERLSGGEDGKDRKRKLADNELSHSERPASLPRGDSADDALVTHSAYFDRQGSVLPPAAPAAAQQVFHLMPTFRQAVSEAKTPVTPASPQAVAPPPPMEKLRPRVLDMGVADAPSEHAVGGADGVRVLDLTHGTDYVEVSYASQVVVFPSVGS